MNKTIYQLMLIWFVFLTLPGCATDLGLTAAQLKGPPVKVQVKELAQTQQQACSKIKPLLIPATAYPIAAQEAGILADDLLSLLQTVAKQQVMITVRDVNKSCTPHLQAGLASKGHDVLTKTFTAESLPPEYRYLAGTVSTLADKPKPGEKIKDPLAVQYLTKDGNPLTCDYDLMDMAQADGERIEGESDEDLELRNILNEHLPWRGQPPSPVTRIMHGAQAEYSNYVRAITRQNKEEQTLTWLNKPEAPLTALTYNGEIYRLQQLEQVLNFYRCHNIELPPEWNIQY